jgi:hypothetical protein
MEPKQLKDQAQEGKTNATVIDEPGPICRFIDCDYCACALGTSTVLTGNYVTWEPVGEFDLVSNGPFSAWLHPAVSTIKPTSPASPSLPDEKIARSRANDGILRQVPRLRHAYHSLQFSPLTRVIFSLLNRLLTEYAEYDSTLND